MKLLQIQPAKDIIIEYIKDEDYKYLRLIGAFYLRLTGKPVEVYEYLEPLLNDFRKIRYRKTDGTYVLTHVDEVVDWMLTKDFLFDTTLPRIPYRCGISTFSLLLFRSNESDASSLVFALIH